MTLHIAIESDRVQIGERFAVTFQRTLRIPNDGRVYPLPPGLGRLPVRQTPTEGDPAPVLFVPLHVREALWLGFDAPAWHSHVLLVGLGRVNAVTGDTWRPVLDAETQNYLVCPPQLWLDGVKVDRDRVAVRRHADRQRRERGGTTVRRA